jgi:hypothetical protein
MTRRFLTKPLRDGLVGLQRKIDQQLDGTKTTQAIYDHIRFVLIETARIDGEEVRL